MSNATSNRKVVSNSLIYTLSGLLMKCFSFFLLPLYTTFLTKEDYGVTSIANSFLSTMSFVAAFSLYSAVMRFYVDLKDKPEKLKRFYGSVVLFVLLSGIGIGGLLTVFRGLLSKYVFSGIDFYPVILVCLLALIFNCQHTIYENILRSQQKAAKCSILSIAYFLVSVGLNILFVVVFRMGAVGVLLATLVAGLLYTVFFFVDMLWHRAMTFCLDRGLLKDALKYSLPILPHNLATHIAQLISKILIGGTDTLGTLGLYTVATQFSMIADTVQTYVHNAYSPWLFEKLNEKSTDYKRSIRSVVNMLCGAIGFLFIGISLFAQDYILLFLDDGYAAAWKFVPLAVLVFGIKTMYYFYVSILFYHKSASRILFVSSITGSLINILLSAVMIPQWGAYGSIGADAIAMLVRVIIVVVISRRYEDVGLHVMDFVKNFLLITVFTFGGLVFSYWKFAYTFSWLNFGYKVLVVFLYMGVMFLMYRKQLRALWRNVKKRLARRGTK